MNTATDEDTTMRDDFETAFEDVENDSQDDAIDNTPNEAPTIEAQEETPPVEAEENDSPVTPPISSNAVDDRKENEAPTQSDMKAPAGWKPTEREGWDKVPDNVKAAIDRREKQIDQTMRETAQSRQIANTLQNTLMPYKAIFDAEGIKNPMQAVEGLMQSAASLRMGTPQQKAAEVAGIISKYGVDIEQLDGLLAGEQNTNPMSQLEQMIDQRLQPIMGHFQQDQQFRQQQVQSNAQRTINDFKQNAEFLDDVSNDMADLMDMASARGQTMSMEDAYKKAVAINPEISNIIQQREQQSKITAASQTGLQKQHAASSIRGTQSGGGGGNDNLSLHDQLAQAWDASNGV